MAIGGSETVAGTEPHPQPRHVVQRRYQRRRAVDPFSTGVTVTRLLVMPWPHVGLGPGRPFGPTRRRQAAVDVPLSTGLPGPSQVVSPRRRGGWRRRPADSWTWHPLDGTGARSVDPGQPCHG